MNYAEIDFRMIYGFVDREDCEKILLSEEEGTFMFRFSKFLLGKNGNTDGGITLSFRCSGMFFLIVHASKILLFITFISQVAPVRRR